MMYDLISIGDATIDTIISIHDAELHCRTNKEDCEICLKWGSKIEVDNIDHQVGGNAANNVVGVSRLGLKTAIYVNVGDDNEGKKILDRLKKENVDITYGLVNPAKSSNYSAVLSFQKERTIFVYHQDWDYKLPEMESAKWVYLTSMSKSFSKSAIMEEVLDFVNGSSAKLAFNPGTYQLSHDIRQYRDLLKSCSILILNKEEARIVLEMKPTIDVAMRKLLIELRNLGPKNVIVTDGERGSYGFNGENAFFADQFPGRRLEKTGAGDSYASGVVAALFYGHDLQEAMVWGSINAASVISKVGAQAGLLTKSELLEKIKGSPNFTAKEF